MCDSKFDMEFTIPINNQQDSCVNGEFDSRSDEWVEEMLEESTNGILLRLEDQLEDNNTYFGDISRQLDQLLEFFTSKLTDITNEIIELRKLIKKGDLDD